MRPRNEKFGRHGDEVTIFEKHTLRGRSPRGNFVTILPLAQCVSSGLRRAFAPRGQ